MPETPPRIFVATAYNLHRAPVSGEISARYRSDNERMLDGLAEHGFSVYNTLHEYDYELLDGNPAIDSKEDSEIKACDAYLEIMDARGSRGNGINLGGALVLGKVVILSHTPESSLKGREKAMVSNGRAHELATTTPLNYARIREIIIAQR
jgi:hypothetical protein